MLVYLPVSEMAQKLSGRQKRDRDMFPPGLVVVEVYTMWAQKHVELLRVPAHEMRTFWSDDGVILNRLGDVSHSWWCDTCQE